METTKIIKDQKQTRTTVPSKMVKEAGVETGHVAEWSIKNKKISANIISHKEFMKKVDKAKSLPAQTSRELSEEHPSDLKAIKRRDDAVYTEGEKDGK